MAGFDSESYLAGRFYDDFFRFQTIQAKRLFESQTPNQKYFVIPSHRDYAQMRAVAKVIANFSENGSQSRIISIIDKELRYQAFCTSIDSLDQFIVAISNKIATYRPNHLMTFKPEVFVPCATIAELHGPAIALESTMPDENVADRLAAINRIGMAVKRLEILTNAVSLRVRKNADILEQLVHVINPPKKA